MHPLYIVATPIGNLEDITIRALEVLFSCDVILCEDTRRTGQLMKFYENKFQVKEWTLKDIRSGNYPQLISFYDEIEDIKTDEVIELINQGKKVALVSDGGTPLVSDPGYKLVRKCIKYNIAVDSIPGSSAIITALTLAGLPTNSFMFLGFLPAKESGRLKILTEIREAFLESKLNPTFICYESPFRTEKLLNDLNKVLGNIDVVIARELTKIHQEIIRGKIDWILAKKVNFKGEITVLFKSV